MLMNLVPSLRVLYPLPSPIQGPELVVAYQEGIFRSLLAETTLKNSRHIDDVVDTLLRRESKGSTGLGRGVAIPHARTEFIERPIVVMGLPETGIDWNAQDGELVQVFLLILVPLEQSDLYLKIVSRLTSLVRIDGFIDSLQDCRSEDAVLKLIHDAELRLKLGSAFSGSQESSSEPA